MRLNVGSSFVHDIPCFDLPLSPSSSNYMEASLLERAKWNRSLKARTPLNISLPINLISFEESPVFESKPKPIEKDEKFVRPMKRDTKQPFRLEVVTLRSQCVGKDIFPVFNSLDARRATSQENQIICRFCPRNLPHDEDLCVHLQRCTCGSIQFTSAGIVASKMSDPHPTDDNFSHFCAPSTDVTTDNLDTLPRKGKSRYPSMTKIPEDLPCHERYIPCPRQSIRVLRSQNSPSTNVAQVQEERDCKGDAASDSSSIYSQDSGDVSYEFAYAR
jgi:hypothetical protein